MACIFTITQRVNSRARARADRRHKRLLRQLAFAACCLAGTAQAIAAAEIALTPACKGQIYLSFDTGNMSQAQFIADTLRQHQIKATFFLANEKTTRGDFSLDPSWAQFWRARVAEGHAFGSHTFDHVRLLKQQADGSLLVKPQFGAQGGQTLLWNSAQYCADLQRVDQRFQELTGSRLDPIWRAPAGVTSSASLAAAKQCGYTHFGWAKAGFSGDELPSQRYPNAQLLQKSLSELKDGDILMAHLGIWSRQDAWAPGVLPLLIKGLQQKGFCFATLRAHPAYPAAAISGK